MRRTDRIAGWLGASAALTLVLAACSDDDGTATAGDAGGGGAGALDTNGDGEVQFGIATSGDANDDAYYQATTDGIREASDENGWEEPIVVDLVQPADATTALRDLAQQGVDVVVSLGAGTGEMLPVLSGELPEVFWWCAGCSPPLPDAPGVFQHTFSAPEVEYAAGYATGLVLQEAGGDAVVHLGCCDLDFEHVVHNSFAAGLHAVDPSFTATYVPTGDFPYDFENTANATAALQAAIENGADAVYPWLGGALRPVVQAANEAGLVTMSSGSSAVCEPEEELDFDIAVAFDGGDFVRAVIPELIDGSLEEGSIKHFRVGVDPEVGAFICDPTPEQEQAMDELFAQIASGGLQDEFEQIEAEAYGAS